MQVSTLRNSWHFYLIPRKNSVTKRSLCITFMHNVIFMLCLIIEFSVENCRDCLINTEFCKLYLVPLVVTVRPFVGKCRLLLDGCNVATHRGKSFCENCHARLLPTTTIIFLLPTDSSFSSVINAISKPISVQAAVQICKSLLNSDFHHYCVEDDIILANPLLQRENDCWKNRRLRAGGGDQQQVEYILCIYNPVNTITY